MQERIRQSESSESQIRSVELFSGIGGFRFACDALNIKTVWANDNNPTSCGVYRQAFGNEELEEGDIGELSSHVPPHDLLTAGFPCQPFSSAGKKQGARDPRGTLFEEIVKILGSSRPRWFVLENVKHLLSMEAGDHFATILLALSELDYFVEWRLLNATYFGLPQNRQRVVIVGERLSNIKRLFPESSSVFLASHEDLKSVIRENLYGLQDINGWKSLEKHHKRFPNWGACFKGKFYARSLDSFSLSSDTPTLETVLEQKPSDEFFMDATTKERIKKSISVDKLIEGVRILYNQGGGARQGYTIFGTDGVAPALIASHSRHYERYKVGNRYRRLTNTEYARLQGFPDKHCSGVIPNNQYGLYGNAVPPPLVKWVIEGLIGKRSIPLSTIEPVENTQIGLGI